MVDLSATPFNLDQDAINWVHSTIDSLTLGEKIGQLFINHNNEFTPEYLDEILNRYHVGGMRYRPGDAIEIQGHARYAQIKSKVPLLIASNPRDGRFRQQQRRHFVCTHLQAPGAGRVAPGQIDRQGHGRRRRRRVPSHRLQLGVRPDRRHPQQLAEHGHFHPGTFGNTPDIVIERAKEYFDGITAHNMVCAMKHFPGDGIDERDRHVVTSYNTLPMGKPESTSCP